MMRLILFSAFILWTSLASAQKFMTEEGKAVFLSEAPLSSFEGESDYLAGLIDLEQNLLDFYLDLNTLETGIGLRDRHMRENYLETEEFPFAEFTGKLDDVPSLEMNQQMPVKAIGKFKIHGVEREIEVNGFLTWVSEDEINLEASFEVLLSDYEIPLPKLVFYELAENQKVTLTANLKKTQ
ncbi:YceI family protein [Algoriphagus sediminis]|uniref:YceI family protein n=1 Tax=Algoriphagus sediminis TaxID=3057113 RepID=A0ABT7YDG8_9BACT|nr:YceI family protein [Algoriphagus sediminis]MDN3204565.1 YceI family protein [Algoriphagus sediminis]